MKRSDIRKTIEWVMYNNHPALDYKDVSEQILDAIEAEGMLPPYCGKMKQVNIEDKWGQDTGKTEYCRVILNEWDEE